MEADGLMIDPKWMEKRIREVKEAEKREKELSPVEEILRKVKRKEEIFPEEEKALRADFEKRFRLVTRDSRYKALSPERQARLEEILEGYYRKGDIKGFTRQMRVLLPLFQKGEMEEVIERARRTETLGLRPLFFLPPGVIGSFKWAQGIKDRWTPEQIMNLQGLLGLPESGIYDFDTMKAHIAYLEAKAAFGKEFALQQLEEVKGMRQEVYIQQEQRRWALQSDIITLWVQTTGVEPSEADLAWATRRYGGDMILEPLEQLKLKEDIRASPEFQKRWPGIPRWMSVSQYDDLYQQMNEYWLRTRMHPLSKNVFAGMLAGKFPPHAVGGLGGRGI